MSVRHLIASPDLIAQALSIFLGERISYGAFPWLFSFWETREKRRAKSFLYLNRLMDPAKNVRIILETSSLRLRKFAVVVLF